MVLKDILRKYRKPFEFHGDKDVLHEVNILNVKICLKIPSALLFFSFYLFIWKLVTNYVLCAFGVLATVVHHNLLFFVTLSNF